MASSSESDAGSQRFRRKPAAAGGAKKRNGRGGKKKNFEAQLAAAMEYSSSEDEATRAARVAGGSKGAAAARALLGGGSDDSDVDNDGKRPVKKVAKERKKKKDNEETLESTMKLLRGETAEEEDDDEEPLKKAMKLFRKKKQGIKTKVGIHKQSPNDKSGDESSGGENGRFLRRGAGDEKAKQKRKANGDSGSEEELEINDGQEEAWMLDLDNRRDQAYQASKTHDHHETAFSLKMCDAFSLRRLRPEHFLGGQPKEAGGRLLADTNGKINLHFLLSTYMTVCAERQRKKNGDESSDQVRAEDYLRLRWLITRAHKLKLVNRGEINKGRVGGKRLDYAKRSGNWSLSFLQNRAADGSGDELTPDKNSNDPSPGDADKLELAFLSRASAAPDKRDQQEAVSKMRSHIQANQANINATSSHNLDLKAVQKEITAPDFSFDWEAKDGEDDDDGGLEVDMPEESKKVSMRDIFRSQMQRSRSFNQAKQLGKDDRTTSSTSLPEFGRSTSDGLVLEKRRSKRSLTKELDDVAMDGPPHQTSAPSKLQRHSVSSEMLSDGTAALLEADILVQHSATERPEQEGEPTAEHDAEARGVLAEEFPAAGCAGIEPSETASGEREVSVHTAAGVVSSAEEPLGVSGGQMSVSADGSELPVDAANATGALVKSAEEVSMDISSTPDEPVSQGWMDISPTMMWGPGEPDRAAKVHHDGAGKPEPSVEISPTLPFFPPDPVEISPTLPFVPHETPAAPAKEPAEISPTLPFVPHETPAAREADMAHAKFDISPTVPFLPRDEISPTLPFIPREEGVSDGIPALPLHSIPGTDLTLTADVEMQDARSTVDIREDARPSDCPANMPEHHIPLSSTDGVQNKKRLVRHISMEDSEPSDEGSTDVDEVSCPPNTSVAGLAGPSNEVVVVLERDPKRRREEREWIQHKRRLARQEGKLSKQQETKNQEALRREAKLAQQLGATTMSEADQAQFDAMFAGFDADLAKSGQQVSAAMRGISQIGVPVPDDHEPKLFGGLKGSGMPRKTSFLR